MSYSLSVFFPTAEKPEKAELLSGVWNCETGALDHLFSWTLSDMNCSLLIRLDKKPAAHRHHISDIDLCHLELFGTDPHWLLGVMMFWTSWMNFAIVTTSDNLMFSLLVVNDRLFLTLNMKNLVSLLNMFISELLRLSVHAMTMACLFISFVSLQTATLMP